MSFTLWGECNQRCYDPERGETGYWSCPACGGRKPAGAGLAMQGWGGAEGISSSFSAVLDLKRLLASQVGMLRMQMDVWIWSPGKKFGDLDWRNLIWKWCFKPQNRTSAECRRSRVRRSTPGEEGLRSWGGRGRREGSQASSQSHGPAASCTAFLK